MKKYKNNYVRIISILLILCTLCGTASAADISSITSTPSPIEVSVNNSTASFVLKNNDSEYYKYALEIMNTDDETYLLCDTFEANETAKLTNIKTDTEYPVWLEVYSETDVLFYDGFFVVDTSSVPSVSLTKVKTKTNTEKMSEEDIESLFEMTDEQYGKLFSSLDIPSFISEEDAKAAKHVKRLEEYEDSYDKIGYKNADGTNTLYIFSSPVKYMDENGELQDADPNISETTGTEKSEGYSFVNDYGELKTYFADSLSNDKGIKIKKNDIEFEFGFTVKEKKENALTKLTSKVKNIFSKPDNKATVFSNNREKKLEYAKVENGIDIVSLPTTNGAVQTLILDDVPENNKLTFWVESNGLTPELDLYNKNVLFSTENDYVFSVGNVEIEDSATEDQIQSGLHFSTDNTVKILNNQNGRSLVEVSLDEDVLTSPTTVYPVSVTLSAAANETNSTESENSSITTLSTTSAPSEIGSSYFQDRTVYTNDSEDPANSPYLIIGDNNYYTGGYYDDSNCTYVAPGYVYRKGHVFMKYDVSSLTNIDPKLVDDAQLVLREGSGNNSELEVDLYRVTKPWTESTVDISYVYECDNQYSGNNDIVFADSGTGIEYEIDVAHMLTDNLLYSQGKDGGVPNYGFHLFTNDLYTSVSKHICSSEHSNIYYRPKVVISYDDPFPLTLGYETAHGYINAADPSDWYSFTPIDTCLYSIFTTSDVDTYGQLFDSSFNLLIADDDSGEENNFNITYNLTAGQTYYIRARGLNYGDTGFYFIYAEYAFEEIFAENNEEIENILSEIDILLNDYLQQISPPRYYTYIEDGVEKQIEINSTNKFNTNYQGQNIYLFLYEWYEEHIWPYEKELPQWATSANIPGNEEATKRAALNDWCEKVYGATTWEGIVNGLDNYVDVLYYEIINIDETLHSALSQIVGGNYSDEVTITGTAGQIALSFSGVDVVTDVRDLTYDVTHWEWSWSHAGQTLVDLVAIVPVVGAVKNLDELTALTKNIDSISELAGSVDNVQLLFNKIDEFVLAAKNTGKLEDLLNDTETLVKWASHRGENYPDIVMLGKWANDSTSYDKVAQSFKCSYFGLPSSTWSELENIDVGKTKLWKVNEGFLDNHIKNNSVFYFSHNPFNVDGNTGFGKELQHLIANDYKFSTTKNADGFWYAYK